MWKQIIKDYFSFTKKERIAVITLAAVIVIVFLLPYCIPAAKNNMPSVQEVAIWKKEIDRLKDSGTVTAMNNANRMPDQFVPGKTTITEKAELFYFDPNTLAAGDWKRLGLRDRTIRTIQNYLTKGGHFNKPADLQKVYGLTAAEVERLLPYVQIAGNKQNESRHQTNYDTGRAYPFKKNAVAITDINMADTAAFVALPGIGSKLAARIIHFRDKLGGFYSVEQVGETFGLSDSVFRKIKPLLRCTNSAFRQLNVNAADATALKQHPYIGWRLSGVIVEYRKQHGDYKTIDDLLQIDIITPEIFSRLRPYLDVK